MTKPNTKETPSDDAIMIISAGYWDRKAAVALFNSDKAPPGEARAAEAALRAMRWLLLGDREPVEVYTLHEIKAVARRVIAGTESHIR